MRLLRKQLCCTQPSLLLLWLAFYLICCRSLFKGLHQRYKMKQLQGKLQRCKLVLFHLESSWPTISPAAQLVKTQEASFWPKKSPSHSSFPFWIQSQGEVQKSSLLWNHLNFNMLKGYYGVFAWWHQKFKLPTSALTGTTSRIYFPIYKSRRH